MNENPTDTATVVGSSGGNAASICSDGPCLTETLQNLGEGLGNGGKKMPPEVTLKVKADAVGLLERVVKAYESDVAEDEVGATGAGVASGAPPIKDCPTGLLYGRVQSGKTVAMIALSAAALDNGFRVIVVLTSDNVKLVEQTAKRFEGLAHALVLSSTRPDAWEDDKEHVAEHVAGNGVVLISAKNPRHLEKLVGYLETIGAGGYPALILDDEADQATLDTTAASRAAGRAGLQPSTINVLTVGGDEEEGQSVRERLHHHVFVQVTATPYALLLQNVGDKLRPVFTQLLEPGASYTGGAAFFSDEHVNGEKPPLVFVDEGESTEIENADPGAGSEAPEGLKRALSFFLVAAGAQLLTTPQVRVQGQNFLCHTSQKTQQHETVADLIRGYLKRIGEQLKPVGGATDTVKRLEVAYADLERTLPNAPPLAKVIETITKRLPRRQVVTVNSNADPVTFGAELNFIVGGNILGRGLTIDNLLVTYYVRRAKVSQMDTVLQHARMFGYRKTLMPFTRVYLPETLAVRFNRIHDSETKLREVLAAADPTKQIPVQTPKGLRATRRNVLDTNSLGAHAGGDQIYPLAPKLPQAAELAKLEKALVGLFGDTLIYRNPDFVPVSLENLLWLLRIAPFSEEDAGSWDTDLLETILIATEDEFDSQGYVYAREMERTKRLLTTGAASGAEYAKAKQLDRPVLFLFRDRGLKLGQGPFWYPSVVLPPSIPTQVFNITR
jgi:hypothetical protein